MGSGETELGEKVAIGRRGARAAGTVALVALLALGVCAAAASAEPLSMTFTESRANVGKQLFDAALFEAPDTAPLEAQIDPGSGSITGGVLRVPQFATHITTPIDANVTVDFDIGVVSGSFDRATGALTLEGTAGGTLTATSEAKECTVSTEPSPLIVSTSGNSGGANPRSGTAFTHGLTGAGAIAGQWTDMHAAPVGGDTSFCSDVESQIGGPGGVWLVQEGDVTAPAAPQLASTDPASPGSSGTPRIRGAAEAGSTVRVYAGAGCAGTPVATASAAKLDSPGIAVAVAEGATASFSATATDVVGNTSDCSAPISYTHLKAPAPCVVPKLKGKSLQRARMALEAAHCSLGKVRRPKHRHRGRHGPLVVKSSQPPAGTTLEGGGQVGLKLGPKPRRGHR